MKKILLTLTLSLLLPSLVMAHGNSSASTEELLNQIRNDQGLLENQNIDCNKLSDHELEEIGESVMSLMHPDPKAHEAMDKMMGGEGSESLKQAHIMMAQKYLGCVSNNTMGDMMMGGMMQDAPFMSNLKGTQGYGVYQGPHMGFGIFSMVFAISLWILIILGIIWLFKEILNLK